MGAAPALVVALALGAAPALVVAPARGAAPRSGGPPLHPATSFALPADRSCTSPAVCLSQDLLCPPTLTLKLGCHVILLKNCSEDKRLVNGSRGVVVGFEHNDNEAEVYHTRRDVDEGRLPKEALDALQKYPVVQFDVGKRGAPVLLRRTVVPEEWKIEQGGNTVARRVQVPLKLAW